MTQLSPVAATRASRCEAHLRVLEDTVWSDLGDPDLWFAPDGYRDSLALCVIDAVYSDGDQNTSAVDVVERYIDHRRAEGVDAYTDGLTELLRTFNQIGGEQNWAEHFSEERTAADGADAATKACAVHQVARDFTALGVSTTDDLRDAIAHDRGLELRHAWCGEPGQWSGATWSYALTLAGIPGVTSDPVVTRYVARSIGKESVSPEYAIELMIRLARRAGWDLLGLDDAVWQFESARD